MPAEVWAILGHYNSAIEKPLRNDCGKVSKSRSRYQRDKVLGISTYTSPKNPLPGAVVNVVMLIFNHLGS